MGISIEIKIYLSIILPFCVFINIVMNKMSTPFLILSPSYRSTIYQIILLRIKCTNIAIQITTLGGTIKQRTRTSIPEHTNTSSCTAKKKPRPLKKKVQMQHPTLVLHYHFLEAQALLSHYFTFLLFM